MTSLDPLYRFDSQIMEPLVAHGGLSRKAARARSLELLQLVQIPEPDRKLRSIRTSYRGANAIGSQSPAL